MNGYIVKGIGGFYYVRTEAGIIECKPRGIFRKQKITPVAGDEVTVETENGASVIAEIAPRKNVFVRPPVANLDVLFLVASTTQPTPSTLVLDKLSAIAVDKGVQPVIVCTKADLGEAEFLRKAYERSTLPFIAIHYDTGEGLDEVKQWIAGRLCAFCGNSGVGKSTLLNLIPRFYDVTSGKVTVDGIDVRDMPQETLHSLLGYVPQKGILFSGSIASNLKFGGEQITDADMKKAAAIAQAAEFIDAKPEGYDSPIAQGGTNVSGGQKQRLSIARAIAKAPRIYLFDDSFSALDYKTDVTLRRALKAETGDATVIIVAQRISTVLHANQILVLDEGRLVGRGTHAQLMASCPEYQEIARSQLSQKELDLKDLNTGKEEK